MGWLRNRSKDEVRSIAYEFAMDRDLPWSNPSFVRRARFRSWQVTTSGQYRGGQTTFIVHDPSGEVDDVEITC
ncbi:MAG: hypothetical protein V3V01_20365 [Acidimicrobiales bacterium]